MTLEPDTVPHESLLDTAVTVNVVRAPNGNISGIVLYCKYTPVTVYVVPVVAEYEYN